MDHIEGLESLRPLWDLIKRGNCIAWVGAGFSTVAGYPQWSEAISILCVACGVTPFTGEPSAEILLDKAEECKNANAMAYRRTLEETFGRPPVQNRIAYDLIMTLPFKAYVTTNFDPLLALTAATRGYTNLFSYPNLPVPEIERSSNSIFYLHGLARQNNIPRGDNLVLSRSDFDTAYNGSVRIFLDTLLLSYPILFLGCSLAEPAVHEAMRRVHRVHDQIRGEYPRMTPPRRYVVLPVQSRIVRLDTLEEELERDCDTENTEEEQFKELAIQVFRYHARDPQQHYEVEAVLGTLCGFHKKSVDLEPKVGYDEGMPS